MILAPRHPMAAIPADIEQRLERADVGWTFLRVGKLDANALGYATPLRDEGAKRALAPTGPEAMTEADIVRTIGEVIGSDARVVEISLKEARAEMLASGVTPHLADAALDHWRRLVDEPEPLTTVVPDVTGRPARTFASWVRENLDAFL